MYRLQFLFLKGLPYYLFKMQIGRLVSRSQSLLHFPLLNFLTKYLLLWLLLLLLLSSLLKYFSLDLCNLHLDLLVEPSDGLLLAVVMGGLAFMMLSHLFSLLVKSLLLLSPLIPLLLLNCVEEVYSLLGLLLPNLLFLLF